MIVRILLKALSFCYTPQDSGPEKSNLQDSPAHCEEVLHSARCGATDKPVFPTCPIISPRLTFCPFLTLIAIQMAVTGFITKTMINDD